MPFQGYCRAILGERGSVYNLPLPTFVACGVHGMNLETCPSQKHLQLGPCSIFQFCYLLVVAVTEQRRRKLDVAVAKANN